MDGLISILVVDDDPEIRFATARLLKSAGYRVLEAEDAAGCFSIAREQRPDLILLDVNLPDMSGFDLCRTIKADPSTKGIYVMMLSGSATEEEDRVEGLEMGADGYLIRPISNRELLARMASMQRIILAERERDRLIEELKNAIAQVKILSGLLPICSNCKKIRDDKGYWRQLEAYIRDHSEAEFTHGICPECMKLLYGDLMEDEADKGHEPVHHSSS
jgi:CheY-like chemotaxis protein